MFQEILLPGIKTSTRVFNEIAVAVSAGTMKAIDVTFTTDEGTPRTAAIERAE